MRRLLLICLFLLIRPALSWSQDIPGYEVYVMLWGGEEETGYWFSEPWNISRHTGYDNQPSFSPDGQHILFSSIRDGIQSDIFSYQLPDGPLKRIAGTAESEYSPEYIDQTRWIRTVRVEADGTQRLWRIRNDGKKARLLYPDFRDIGYYGAMPGGAYATFVLPEPFMLQYWKPGAETPLLIDTAIGRSLKPMPGTDQLFYVSKRDSTRWTINMWSPQHTILELTGVQNGMEDMAWSMDGNLFMAWENRIYYFDYNETNDWYQVADLSLFGLKNIYRLAFSPDGKWLAFVVEE